MFSAEKTEHNRITSRFSDLKLKGEKGLITFVTAGDPNLQTTKEIVLALEKAGADIIELGVPYSDPVADGPVIQRASQRALRAGTNLKKIFQTVRELRETTQIPILLMTYFNPLLRYGLEAVAADAFASGVDGFIIPDLPFEEKSVFVGELKKHNIFLIPLVAPTSGYDRIKQITEDSEGFIYCVSLTGVTGVREGIPQNLKDFMENVRKVTSAPLAVGFGISNPEQVSVVSQYCDAVIVGSALVKTIGEKGDSDELIESVTEFTRNLKQPMINTNS
ncbi:MAG TPA: tryptophan synthase subunit alpha [Desulfobacteria bacterium]|nr:tryptophan synthase subunit alpha [Desulfobacteria bacterium]